MKHLEERSAVHSHRCAPPLSISVSNRLFRWKANTLANTFPQQTLPKDTLIDVRQTYHKGGGVYRGRKGRGVDDKVAAMQHFFSALHKQVVYARCETRKGERRG